MFSLVVLSGLCECMAFSGLVQQFSLNLIGLSGKGYKNRGTREPSEKVQFFVCKSEEPQKKTCVPKR